MCGRFTLRTPMSDVAKAFGVAADQAAPFLFNIAPTQEVAAIRITAGGQRELCALKWGLVPGWADDMAIGNRMINARAETVATKPAYRRSFKSRRCLVIADGFYEWQKNGRQKQPFYIRLKGDRPFGIAGLWESWSKGGSVVESCALITTTANELVAPIHDRMPVIVPPEAYDLWLSPETQETELLASLLRPYAAVEMDAYPVSTRVNSPAYNEPDCIHRLPDADRTLFG
ncbi:MAG: SOS response-associated peptidase [Pirellulales bacterium]